MRSKLVLIALVAAGVLAAPSVAQACDKTWGGGTGFADVGANWSGGTTPLSSQTICVPSGTMNVRANMTVAGATIGDGGGTGATVNVQGQANAGGDPVPVALHLSSGGEIKSDGTVNVIGGVPGGSLFSSNPGATVVNHGALRTVPGGPGTITLHIPVDNRNLFEVNESAIANGNQSWTNRAQLTIAAGKTLEYTGTGQGPTFRQEAGNLNVAGRYVQHNGHLVHAGGTVSGTAETCNTALDASGPGAATYRYIVGPPGCDSGELAGDIAPDKTVIADNPTTTAIDIQVTPASYVNHGSFLIGGTGQVHLERNRLENRGLLRFSGPGRRLSFTQLANGPGGTIDVDNVTLEAQGGLTQAAGGTLDVDAGRSLVRGTATLDGRLRVTTTGPAWGSPAVVEGPVAGRFSSTEFVGSPWVVNYTASSVFLTPPGGGGGGGAGGPAPGTLVLRGAKALKGGRVRVRARISGAGVVSGRATAKARLRKGGKPKRITMATGRKTAAGAGDLTLTLRVGKSGRRALALKRSIKASLAVTFRPVAGAAATARRSVRFKR
jgi:hypothetical protein